MNYDLAIVGLGAHGSSILHRAAQSGLKVIGIDRFSPPHTSGSHHGDSRITRLLNNNGEDRIPIIQAGNTWRETFEDPSHPMFVKTGYLKIAPPDNSSEHTQKLAKQFDFEIQHLSHSQLKNKFPAFQISASDEGVYEPGGGYLNPEAVISTNLKLAKTYGAEIILNEEVLKIDNQKLTLRKAGVIKAKKIALATGAYMTDLVPEIAKHLKPTRQYVAWFKIRENYEVHKVLNSPTFVWQPTPERLLYGFPAIDGPKGGFKIGSEGDLSLVSPTDPHMHKAEVMPHEIGAAFGDITRYFPFLENECVKAAACMYTVTPDEEFIIDTHPAHKDLWIVSACNSRGFKFAHGIGIMMTDLIKDGASPLWNEHFSLKRFQ